MNPIGVEVLKGQVIENIERSNYFSRYGDHGEQLIFTTKEKKYRMYHDQNCCESVIIDDICGELDWLIGSEILVAEKRQGGGDPKDEYNESFTWTFYELATIKGSVTIRWYGTSNGYYSEEVDFEEVKL